MSKEDKSLVARMDDYLLEKYTRSTPEATNQFAVHSYATAGLVLGSSAIVYGSIFTGVLGGISALLAVAQKNVSRVEKFSEQRNKPVSYVRSKPEQYIQPLMLGASVAFGTDTIGHAIIGDQPLHEIVKNAQLAIGLSAYVSGIYATSAHGKQKQDVQTQDQEVRR